MESESPGTGGGGGGTLLVLEPKSLRSFTTNDEYLFAMKEDLADWFACLYKMHIEADSFLAILETGVILCRHANEVQHFYKEKRIQGAAIAMRSYFIRNVPEGHVTFRTDVKPGTFQARDNVSNFITWCRQLGIPDVLRFETDDLVLRKNEKSVILCLLELARVGAKMGMLAPTLVQMEQEIDEELESAETGKPPPQIKTCDMKSLDELVRELVGQCTCPIQFPLVKVGEGKYQIGDSKTLIFVRVLRNHVMVRVGGGWDTLENYLNKHDPCRCHFRGHRGGGTVTGSRHQVLRRSSTSALIANRANSSPSPSPSPSPAVSSPQHHQPTSPRRMSAATVPATNSYHSHGFVRGSSPAPGSVSSSGSSGGFTKGPSPARSASPSLGKAGVTTPLRCASPVQNSMGLRRVSSPATSLRDSRESSVGRSSASGHSRPCSPATLPGQSLRQSADQQRTPTQPQHQAVQRCKSPSPSPGNTRCVSPALSGNRTLPRPISRGASAHSSPRSQSPAFQMANSAKRPPSSVARSISFDSQGKDNSLAEATSRSTDALDKMDYPDVDVGQSQGYTPGGQTEKGELSIDQISTMTLSEFKQLISNNLSVSTMPEGSVDGSHDGRRRQLSGVEKGAHMKRSNSADPQNLSWSSVRDKARSVCNTLASSVSSRRPSGNSTASIIARRNLPKSPASDNSSSRPKTPAGTDRPKTPVSTYRPKTPVTSAYAYRPKTPTAVSGSGEGVQNNTPRTLSRPKTPTSMGKSSRNTESVAAKTATARNISEATRPKTPTSIACRVEVPNPRIQNTTVISTADEVTTNPRVKTSSFVYTDDSDTASVDNLEVGSRHPTSLSVRSASSNDIDDTSVSLSLPLSRRSQSPADELDTDNSEIAEVMMGGRIGVLGQASVRDRPSTPSRIPKPSFIPRPSTPSSVDNASSRPATSSGKAGSSHTVHRILPRPSTPVGRASAERQLSTESAGSEKPPVTPRRHSQTPRSTSRSYTEMFHARRAQTPGPGSSSSSSGSSVSAPRSTTPGPGMSTNGLSHQQFDQGRKGSLTKTVDMAKLRKAKSVTNLLAETGRMSMVDVSSAGGDRSRQGMAPQRAASINTQQRLQRQKAFETEGEVLMVSRNSQGGHSVRVTNQNKNVTYSSANRGRLQQSASFDNERVRSKTPGPGVGTRPQPRGIIRKPAATQRVTGAQSKTVNRTEAWVDSTLHDPKRKQLPSRPRRPMTPNSLSIQESELLSRPLEEIKASLPSPVSGMPTPDPEVIEAPPEDPEMYKKMEQLFEKYREMELRASVCDTPGGNHRGYDNFSRSSGSQLSSGGGQGQAMYSQSVSSRSSSMRTGVTNSASFSSGISSQHTDSSRGTSVENDRFSKESSPAAAAATAPYHYSNGAASNNGEYQELNPMDDSACVSVTPRPGHQGAPAVSADDIVDMDEETLSSNPSALVSKIKEILQVRPRKDDSIKTGTRTRIPGPASLLRNKRSKSVSNISQEISVFANSSSHSAHESAPYANDVTRDESTNSDVSSEYSRCETPVPKLAQPLTTGRSTLFCRERQGVGVRSMSQDDHVSSSSTVSSSSRQYWDEDGEYV